MNNLCSYCQKPREIVYTDSCPKLKFSLFLCEDCIIKLEFCDLASLKKCQSCGTNFIQKHSWQKICLNCWKRNKTKERKEK